MTSPVVRIYATEKQARKVVSKLRENGFTEDQIHLATPDSVGVTGSSETLSNLLKVGRLLPGDSKRYADSLEQGRSLVIALPPFGYAQSAMEIMDSFDPIRPPAEEHKTTTVASRSVSPAAWDDAAPLSSALGWGVLSRGHRPTPFSDFMGLKPLSRGLSFESPYCQLLKSSSSGLSALVGLRLLKEEPAPLSSYLGLKALADDQHPGEASFCQPLLSSDPTPLSSKMGYRVLSPNPTPLSSALDMRVLKDGR